MLNRYVVHVNMFEKVCHSLRYCGQEIRTGQVARLHAFLEGISRVSRPLAEILSAQALQKLKWTYNDPQLDLLVDIIDEEHLMSSDKRCLASQRRAQANAQLGERCQLKRY